MAGNVPLAPETTILQAAADAVARRVRPAWVIDAVAGRVIAANAAGAERLGLGAGKGAHDLDRASPACRELRRAPGRLTAVGTITDELAFWTPRGTERMLCVIERFQSTDRALLIVEVAPDRDQRIQIVPERIHDHTSPPVRDDTATLQEIARRIREGQKTLLAMPPLGIAGDEAAPLTVAPVEAAPAAEVAEKVVNVERLDRAAVEDLFAPGPGPAARAAHELKTPIGAVAAAAEIMRDERLGRMDSAEGRERYLGYAADIAGNAHHALSVIDRMLGGGAAVPAAEEKTPAPEPIDIGGICVAAVAAAEPMARRAGLDLTSDIAARLPRVAVDPVGLRQILLNLLTNAIKFTPAGGTVELAASADRRGSVCIEVRDAGEGMTRAAIARALDPHASAVKREEPRAGGGLGLGLPLVQKLAHANGANLVIDSVLGQGTVVALTFPSRTYAQDLQGAGSQSNRQPVGTF